MSLQWLLADELRHLARSRAVLLVLASLPLMLGAGALAPGDRLANLLLFMVAMGSNLAGIVCGATVTASCVADLQTGTPVLFAVRPVPRHHILLARFLAVVLLLAGTMILAIGVAAAVVKLANPEFPGLGPLVLRGLELTLANSMLQGALGVLLGVCMSSMLSAVVLYIFLGVNLGNGVAWLMVDGANLAPNAPWLREGIAVGGAFLLTAALMWLSASIFSRRPL